MEQYEGAEALKVGNPVVIYTHATDDEPAARYVGFLTALDDTFLSAKVTHEWQSVAPEVTPESREELRVLLAKRPLWLLHLQVAWEFRILTIGMDKAMLVDRLVFVMEEKAVESAGPSTGFVPYPLAKHISLGLPVLRLEALNDIRDADVLVDLDFEPEPIED